MVMKRDVKPEPAVQHVRCSTVLVVGFNVKIKCNGIRGHRGSCAGWGASG